MSCMLARAGVYEMTRQDYLTLKSWGDLKPDAPHLPCVGKRVCLPCLANATGGSDRRLDYGPHVKANCKNESPVYAILEGQPKFLSCGQGGSTFHPLPKESDGDKFYATLRKLGHQINQEGDYA